MSKKEFIGRKPELEQLSRLYARKSAALAVIKGRRRIGKSRLIAEFATQHPQARFLSFIGLAPIQALTSQKQLDDFGYQLSQHLKTPPTTFADWFEALAYLAHHIQPGDIILFDEISWMGAKDPSFVPKLKSWWDKIAAEKPHVMLVFCGSVSTWIEDNIINSTAFFGRISFTLTLGPLSISESYALLKSRGFKGSTHDVFKLLSVLGGIPWYLEQVDPHFMADENIKNLCFIKNGRLANEFNSIFHDLFGEKGSIYKKMLHSLAAGTKTLARLREDIGFSHSGTFSKMADHLVTSGFIKKHALWSIKTEKPARASLYALSDPYIRFYLNYIDGIHMQIEKDAFAKQDLSQIPGIDAKFGFQVEHLLIENRELLLEKLGIQPSEVVYDGPYQQKKTLSQQGCQIDYLIQTRAKNLFICEFKFRRQEIGAEIIPEVQNKIDRLVIPRGFAPSAVLFHMGGVSETIARKRYFYRIVDIEDLLSP